MYGYVWMFIPKQLVPIGVDSQPYAWDDRVGSKRNTMVT